MVPEVPKAIVMPLIVRLEFVRPEFGILLNVLSAPLIVLPVSVCVPVSVTTLLSI